MPYFIRSQGRVVGPVEMDRLQDLALKGRLSRSHEISEDRKTWKSAHSIQEIFASKNELAATAKATAMSRLNPMEEKSNSGTVAKPTLDSAEQRREWSYAIDGAQLGPATLGEIQTLIQHGSLSREDLVWKTSMTQWAPASHIPELVVFFRNSGRRGSNSTGNQNPKNKTTAILLALFLGGFGIHQFYLGNTLRGILMIVLLVMTFGIGSSLIALIEAIIIACSSQETFERKWCHLEMQFSA